MRRHYKRGHGIKDNGRGGCDASQVKHTPALRAMPPEAGICRLGLRHMRGDAPRLHLQHRNDAARIPHVGAASGCGIFAAARRGYIFTPQRSVKSM